MGRKPAPQPLTLGDSMRPAQGDNDLGSSRAGETVPNSAVPEETRSPRSPRSPFRFGQKKPESAGGLQALQLTDVLQQQQQQQSPLQSPQHHHQQLRHQTHNSRQNNYPDQQRNPEQRRPSTQHQYQSPTYNVNEGYYPASPLTSPPPQQQLLDQRPPAPATQQQQQSQHPLGHRHARQNEEKASKSGFFFHFGKSSKSSDRLNSPYNADPRSEAMSRDSDQQALSKQSSKQSGMRNQTWTTRSFWSDGDSSFVIVC